jgi:sugar phosphate permease
MSRKSSDNSSTEKVAYGDAQIEHALETHEPLDKEAERKLVRKFDMRLMPILFVLYLFCFIDRSNIGNARIAGLEKDLKLVGFQYNIALTVFYIAYASVEVPSNLIAKRVGPHYWIPFLVFSFGLVSMLTAFVQSFAGLMVARVALGLAEGGVMPCIAHYLSRFYRRSELIFRIAIFVSSSSLSGGFGGLLASGLLSVGHVGDVKGWRNIFLVEGLLSAGLAILAFPLMPKDVEHASYLTEEERALGVARIRSETAGTKKIIEATQTKLIKQGIWNINNWAFGLGFTLVNISVQGLALFSPTITSSLFPGMPTVQVQLRTVPPYMVTWVWSLFVAWLADKFDRRAYVMLCLSPLGIAGYAIFVGSKNPHALYGAMFLVTMAVFPLGPFFLAWAVNSSAPDTMRAVSSAFVVSIGTLGAIIATWSYLPSDQPHRFHNGNSLNLAANCATMMLTLIMLFYSKWENKQRLAGKRDHRLEGLTLEEQEALGSKHPKFMYSY